MSGVRVPPPASHFQTVTGFLLDAAEDRAREVIDERRDLGMSKATFACFAEALDAPGEPVPERVELFRLPRIRLAVDHPHRGRQLASRLLAEALRLAVIASDAAAARLVIVYAIDERAAAFYRKWGFINAPENPLRL